MMAKESKKSNWHSLKPGHVSAPLIVDLVPGGMLENIKKICTKFEESHGIKVQVCPRAGISVSTDAKPEPLKKLGCRREDCLPYQSPGRVKGDCEKNSETFKISCHTCLLAGRKITYKRETGKNAFTRWLVHQSGLQSKSENSALWKHCLLVPISQEKDFSMEIVQCHSTCHSRQVHEAVRILRTDAEIILNSQPEFHQTPFIWVVATNWLQVEQTTAASQGVGAAGEIASQGRRTSRAFGRSFGEGLCDALQYCHQLAAESKSSVWCCYFQKLIIRVVHLRANILA